MELYAGQGKPGLDLVPHFLAFPAAQSQVCEQRSEAERMPLMRTSPWRGASI